MIFLLSWLKRNTLQIANNWMLYAPFFIYIMLTGLYPDQGDCDPFSTGSQNSRNFVHWYTICQGSVKKGLVQAGFLVRVKIMGHPTVGYTLGHISEYVYNNRVQSSCTHISCYEPPYWCVHPRPNLIYYTVVHTVLLCCTVFYFMAFYTDGLL